MAKEYQFTTKSYTDELLPAAVLDASDPIFQILHPDKIQPQSHSNIDTDFTVTENLW